MKQDDPESFTLTSHLQQVKKHADAEGQLVVCTVTACSRWG